MQTIPTRNAKIPARLTRVPLLVAPCVVPDVVGKLAGVVFEDAGFDLVVSGLGWFVIISVDAGTISVTGVAIIVVKVLPAMSVVVITVVISVTMVVGSMIVVVLTATVVVAVVVCVVVEVMVVVVDDEEDKVVDRPGTGMKSGYGGR